MSYKTIKQKVEKLHEKIEMIEKNKVYSPWLRHEKILKLGILDYKDDNTTIRIGDVYNSSPLASIELEPSTNICLLHLESGCLITLTFNRILWVLREKSRDIKCQPSPPKSELKLFS